MKLSLLIILFSILGCTNKLEKAKQRVLTDETTFNSVGDTWQKLHPCKIDTFVTYKTDTLVNTFFSVKTDTLTNNDTTIIENTKTETIIKTIRDSIKYSVADLRASDILNDTINKLKIKAAELNGKLETAVSEGKRFKILYRGTLIFLVLLIVLYFVYRGLKYYYLRK